MTSYYYAVKTLLENNINRLPLSARDVEAIIGHEGWDVIHYDLKDPKSVQVLEQFSVMEDAKKRDGFSLKTPTAKIVFVKRSLSSENKTLVLGHELGHIKEGHFSDTGILGVHSDMSYNDQQEKEANAFMRNIIAPKCILKELRLKKIDDLKKTTLLNDDILKAHYADYKLEKGKYTDDELKLIDNFKAYIDKNKRRLPKKPLIACGIIVSAAALVTATAFISLHFNQGQVSDESPKTQITSTISPSGQPKPTAESNQPTATPIINGDTTLIRGTEYSLDMPVYRVVSKTEVFHKADCSFVAGKDNLTEMTIKSALDSGLRACTRCFK